MMTTTDSMVGQDICRGRTAKAPTITGVLWQGTASITACEEHRLPVAMVTTNKGDMLVVQMYGTSPKFSSHMRWWDARIVRSREWETQDGQMVGDVAPEIAAKIDAILATADDRHEADYRKLCDRIHLSTFWVVDPNA